MKRYRVEIVNKETIVTGDESGKYRATLSEEIKQALNDPNYRTTTAEVRIGKSWEPLGRNIPKEKRHKRTFSTPEPIKPLPRLLRVLKALHLYKDPLQRLIYKGK